MVLWVRVVRRCRDEDDVRGTKRNQAFGRAHWWAIRCESIRGGFDSQTRLRKVAGLSPVPGKTQHSGLNPYFSTNHLPIFPCTLPPSVSTMPNLRSNSAAPSVPAMAFRTSLFHPLSDEFIVHRFIPQASLSSIPLISPSAARRVVTKLEHRLI